MLLELGTSTLPLFKKTVVAYRLNSGLIGFFEREESEQLALLHFFLNIIAEQCQPGEPLQIMSEENSISQPFEKGWIVQWRKKEFSGKAPIHRDEWKAWNSVLEEKSIDPIFARNNAKAQKELSDAAEEKRTGRKKQGPYVPHPGEPDENPWRKEETPDQLLARKLSKD